MTGLDSEPRSPVRSRIPSQDLSLEGVDLLVRTPGERRLSDADACRRKIVYIVSGFDGRVAAAMHTFAGYPMTRPVPSRPVLAFMLIVGLAIGCSDSVGPQASDMLAASDVVTIAGTPPSLSASAPFIFRMLDRCEPESFNAAIGPGTCVGSGKVTFDEFIDELIKKQTHHQWRNQPTQVALKAGRDLAVVNVGGEEHTFTPVAEFGGGFLPDLNALSGNPVPAPECLDFGSIAFLSAGSTTSLAPLTEGTHRFMCCIHPWMRTTAKVH